MSETESETPFPDGMAMRTIAAQQARRMLGGPFTAPPAEEVINERDERDELAGIIARQHTAAAVEEILAAGYSKHSAELAKARRGAKTLGEIIEKQCRDVLEVTGLHHLINEDGDGHWDVVWMRLFEMRDELASLKESTIGRERLRGDSWRDRAQEMELSRDAAIERAEAAEAAAASTPKPPTIATAEDLDGLPTVAESIGYVVIEYNQAGGPPSIPSGDVFYSREDAKDVMEQSQEETRLVGRRERYAVGTVTVEEEE